MLRNLRKKHTNVVNWQSYSISIHQGKHHQWGPRWSPLLTQCGKDGLPHDSPLPSCLEFLN